MSRTDELRDSGTAKNISGGGNAPFVKWGDRRAYVEGEIVSLWESQYGMNARMRVQKASSSVEASPGKGEPRVRVEEGMEVNVGLNYTALTGVTQDQLGHVVHVAFEGWEQSKAGNDYRAFSVFDLGPEDATRGERGGSDTSGDEESGAESEPSARQQSMSGTGPGAPGAEQPPPADDNLPF